MTTDPARRSLLLYAAGAVLGLAIAGAGLFSGNAGRASVPPEAIATVNGKLILRSDFVAQVESESDGPFAKATPDERRKVLQNMLNEELLVQRGLAIELPASDGEVRGALVAGVSARVTAGVTALDPTEAQLRSFYEAHRDRYRSPATYHVADLVVADEGAGRNVAELLRASTAPDAAAQRVGAGAPRIVEGADYVARHELGEALFAAVSTAQPGSVVGPVSSGGKLHVVAILAAKPAQQLDFEAARVKVRADLKEEEAQRARAGNLDYLRKQAEIRVAPDAPQ